MCEPDGAPVDLVRWCSALAERRVVVPVPGPLGVVNRTVRVWEHLFEITRAMRDRLGLLDGEPPPDETAWGDGLRWDDMEDLADHGGAGVVNVD